MRLFVRYCIGAAVFLTAVVCFPALTFAHIEIDLHRSSDISYILVSGNFEYGDLDKLEKKFTALVQSDHPKFITFDSAGGNPIEAMRLGRLIRTNHLSTIQLKDNGASCESACALAFLGGKARYAEPGSIGVHKSSFRSDSKLSREDAVSAIQTLTAEIVSYMSEMGADSALLQLAFRYDANDMRYLSRSEMVRFRVITAGLNTPVQPAPPLPDRKADAEEGGPLKPASRIEKIKLPSAQSGKVQHPAGSVPLMLMASVESPSMFRLTNGTPVTILEASNRWYRVRTGFGIGYLHDTWVYVDQFVPRSFGARFIQIKSFEKFVEAEDFVKKSQGKTVAFITTNGWFAIALARMFDTEAVYNVLSTLKRESKIPSDSFATYGNSYVKKVCCD
jgi:hypothetical protein